MPRGSTQAAQTYCIHGHLLSGPNLYAYHLPDGTIQRTYRTSLSKADTQAVFAVLG